MGGKWTPTFQKCCGSAFFPSRTKISIDRLWCHMHLGEGAWGNMRFWPNIDAVAPMCHDMIEQFGGSTTRGVVY